MPPATPLARLLTLEIIEDLAGERSFVRGESYLEKGCVQTITRRANTLTGRVSGQRDYVVKLTATSDDQLSYSCTCPVGREGDFCKHAVAVALAWLYQNDSNTVPSVVALDDLRPWLLEQPTGKLTDLLLDTASRDDRLREKLLRLEARATTQSVDFASYRRAITRATRTNDFIGYDEADAYADGVNDIVDTLRELLDEDPERHAPAIIKLVEYALKRVETALSDADNSDGAIGGVLHDLQELHLAACIAARPDPDDLARRLFNWALDTIWDTFLHAASTYADVLSERGLATYHQLAEAAWAKLPARKPGDPPDYSSSRFRLTGIMESLARAEGDIDALIAIKSRDLSHAFNYLQIAELQRKAARPDLALEWAERGLVAFSAPRDSRLVEFVADEYHRRGRHDDALDLIWPLFTTHPTLESCRELKRHADQADAWLHWCDRAHLRGLRDGRNTSHSDRVWRLASAQNELIRILLWLGANETAWQEASHRPLNPSVSLQLAASREAERPADVLPLYERAAEACIAQKNNSAYDEAVVHLAHLKRLYLQLNLTDEWIALITRLRSTHRPKRNFIARAKDL